MTSTEINRYITAGTTKTMFNINADRLKKWRDGRGQAKFYNLRTIQLNKREYLYNIEDIEHLIELTNKNKKK